MDVDPGQDEADDLILAVLRDRQLEGYAVMQAISTLVGRRFTPPLGKLLGSLRRLERLGLLTASWRFSAGRLRRAYRITRAGRRVLAGRRKRRKAQATAVSRRARRAGCFLARAA
ncbi:helix-turn-helix transcriptional regulator [Rhizohabitans arisaemae]|uniref:helix-turn-helix transcriptional regulator n=1 Tax=Rhizohabitans arisaemae TaxID=2720610 RepID=UPI0024B0764D|nr:helix-turn-helix transcriptional regulator [Rhizohabitans arisaemae]